MSIQLSVNSFHQMLSHSGLLSDSQLERVKQQFPTSATDTTAKTICHWMIDQSLITEWQAEKLLQARFRGFFLGPYKLLNRVARGGMSTIYAAEQKDSGEIHALKVLPLSRTAKESYLPRFQREAAITQRLQHPHIVRVFGIHSASDGQDAVHFMAMELLQGRDLSEIVNADGSLPCLQAAEYIRQAATGLAYAHEQGLVHRDIKPGNLFVSDDHSIRILDLGLAQDFDSEENLTREFNERVLGTADYLAPEQAADSHTVDGRADIYSLGCSLYFLLTAQPPFTEGTLVQRIVAHQSKLPPPVSQFRNDVPEELLRILADMMAKNRANRIATAAEVATRLNDFLRKAETHEHPETSSLDFPPGSQAKNATVADSCFSNSDLQIVLAPSQELPVTSSDEPASESLWEVFSELSKQPSNVAMLPAFSELLRSIESRCDPSGELAADPRSAELLAVSQRLLRSSTFATNHSNDDFTKAALQTQNPSPPSSHFGTVKTVIFLGALLIIAALAWIFRSQFFQ